MEPIPSSRDVLSEPTVALRSLQDWLFGPPRETGTQCGGSRLRINRPVCISVLTAAVRRVEEAGVWPLVACLTCLRNMRRSGCSGAALRCHWLRPDAVSRHVSLLTPFALLFADPYDETLSGSTSRERFRMAPQQVQPPLSASQLQALLQQQALLLQQLYKKHQQQLQLQLPHQHPNKKVKELMFQQLLRLQQQQLVGLQRPALPSLAASPEIHQIWKELINGIREDKHTQKDWTTYAATPIKIPAAGMHNPRSASPLHTECASEAETSASLPLYGHGVCNWPGCESECENISHFLKHLLIEHALDDRSTAQCRVQMQVVQQLDLQLSKERERLQAMMTHLHLPPLGAHSLAAPVGVLPLQSETADDPFNRQQVELGRRSSLCPSLQETLPPAGGPSRGVQGRWGGSGGGSPTRTPCGGGAVRRSHRPSLSSLSYEEEFELYRNTDIRPPFTYATLIRQAIMAASEMQLTLNEIYTWFTSTFAYFRQNAATWKNAVRHNLSLHKCFVRVENVKGAVWTVDEVEFQKRRSQKMTGSPSMMKHVSSGLAVGSTLGVALQAAVAETTLPGFQCISRGSAGHSERNMKMDSSLQQPLFMKEELLSAEEQQALASASPCSTLNDP
ncbi:Forkhead box protein P2 [Merluccius polli]|uniref:Forkhead box protein P2 n=1 Tax=Merluccius polli TaxID=89951 RepID=A0AA47MXR6_MERPO|nr:Forkhead box protein P2 [Merluccius polli]